MLFLIVVVRVPMVLVTAILSWVGDQDLFALDLFRLGERFWQGHFDGAGVQVLVVLLNLVIVEVWGGAFLARAGIDLYLGYPVTLGSAFRRRRGFWPLLGAVLVGQVISYGLFWATQIFCLGWVLGPGIKIFFDAVLQPLLIPIAVVEGRSGLRAIGRAFNLAVRRFWLATGVSITLLGMGLLVALPQLLVSNWLAEAPVDGQGLPGETFLMVTAIGLGLMLAGELLFAPLKIIVVDLLYFNLRIQTEGVDLALTARGMESPDTPLADQIFDLPVRKRGAEPEEFLTDLWVFVFGAFAALLVLRLIFGTVVNLYLGVIDAWISWF